MPYKELRKIAGSSPHMETCTHKLVRYSDDKLSVLGTVKLPVKSNAGVEQERTFHIAETNQPGINRPPESTQDLGSIKLVMIKKKSKPNQVKAREKRNRHKNCKKRPFRSAHRYSLD